MSGNKEKKTKNNLEEKEDPSPMLLFMRMKKEHLSRSLSNLEEENEKAVWMISYFIYKTKLAVVKI